jgi:hypothetical protein
MGMTEEFETSLQVLRGFDTDISFEVNEIKVTATQCFYFIYIIQSDHPFHIHTFQL